MAFNQTSGYIPVADRPPVPPQTRREVLRRAGGRCEDCGRACRVELHHRHYESIGEERPRDLNALCRECHRRRHVDQNGQWWNDPQEMASYWRSYHEAFGKD